MRALSGGESVLGMRVAYTPGHASHHVCYLHEESGTAFVGDIAAVLIPGTDLIVPPTPPPDIEIETWEESIATVEGWRPRAPRPHPLGPDRGSRAASRRGPREAARGGAARPRARRGGLRRASPRAGRGERLRSRSGGGAAAGGPARVPVARPRPLLEQASARGLRLRHRGRACPRPRRPGRPARARVRAAPRIRFMSPPGAMKPPVPKTVIVSTACSMNAIAPRTVSQRGIDGPGAEAEDGDRADHRHRRAGQDRAPEERDVVDGARGAGIERARIAAPARPRPMPGSTFSTMKAAAPSRKTFECGAGSRPRTIAGEDGECERPEGRRPGVGSGSVVVIGEPAGDGRRRVGRRPAASRARSPRRGRGRPLPRPRTIRARAWVIEAGFGAGRGSPA